MTICCALKNPKTYLCEKNNSDLWIQDWLFDLMNKLEDLQF